MLERVYILEDAKGTVEFLTRGLYWNKVRWHEKVIEDPGKLELNNTYIKFEIRFHDDDNFMGNGITANIAL